MCRLKRNLKLFAARPLDAVRPVAVAVQYVKQDVGFRIIGGNIIVRRVVVLLLPPCPVI
jgi:hypothetical protein